MKLAYLIASRDHGRVIRREDPPVAYFFYNTDADSLARQGRYPVLIKHGFAATSGPFSFGEQLGQLTPGDILLMYENRVGVVAVGKVAEHWDRVSHQPPIYYQPGDDGFEHEYRIKVDWSSLSGCPIGLDELRERLGYTPRGTIVRIATRQIEAEQLIAERLSDATSSDMAADRQQVKIAQKQDWRTCDMPTKRVTLPLCRDFTGSEVQRLKQGIIPQQMEDKWFVYWQDNALYFHRSWTGFCVYIVRLSHRENGYRMVEADANRDSEQYTETRDEYDASMIAYLIDVLLLGREAAFPSDEPPSDAQVIQQWSLMGRAMFGPSPDRE